MSHMSLDNFFYELSNEIMNDDLVIIKNARYIDKNKIVIFIIFKNI